MIGHNFTIDLILQNFPIKSVMIIVGEAPKEFGRENQILEIPTIYTELKRPKPYDLEFAKDNLIQLIHGKNASDELFAAWYIHTLQLNPKTLIALDSAGEIYVL
jgi:hypothetical protein